MYPLSCSYSGWLGLGGYRNNAAQTSYNATHRDGTSCAKLPATLLRARCERPTCRRTAEKRDALPPLHSITSSALLSSVCGTVSPSVLAV